MSNDPKGEAPRQWTLSGPLRGLRVLELASLGPGPFAAMMLSDSGADVLRIDRYGAPPSPHPVLERGRRSLVADLKRPEGVEMVLRLIEKADVLIEGFRPGVMERMGLGPAIALIRNPRVVYARMTGWGQDGPMTHLAGHDPNYIAMTGAVHAIGTPEQPVLPLNIVGDYAGGGMHLAFGIMSALWHARETGQGQVVDVAIVDGVLAMMSAVYGDMAAGRFSGEREGPGAYGSAPFSGVYRCSDGRFISLCAFEPQFYAALVKLLDLVDDPAFATQHDHQLWPSAKARLTEIFATQTRDEWSRRFEGVDACFAPVISMAEAPNHPYHLERGTFMTLAGMTVPAPSPRYSSTPSAAQGPPSSPGEGGAEALSAWGFEADEIEPMIGALHGAKS